jgi:hypothetical protein
MVFRSLVVSLAGLAVAGLAAPALADPSAVGRLNYAGFKARQHCTAFLTDAGHLVTAAHCLRVPADARIHFLQGYDRGSWARHLEFVLGDFRQRPGRDLAVACRAAPAGAGLRLVAGRPRGGEELAIWGYGRPRKEVRQDTGCPYAGAESGSGLRLACRVAQGASGGPVVRRLPDGTYEAVGLASRSGPGGTLAAAVDPAVIAALCD